MGLPAEVQPEDDDLLRLVREASSMTSENEFVTKVNGRIYGELGGLAQHLNKMMKALQSIECPMHLTASELPKAADQLTDLTKFTEEATHRILGYTEQVMGNHDVMAEELASLRAAFGLPQDRAALERVAVKLESLVQENRKVLMDLFTSLEFQDLTGQRLKKIASGLQGVQSRILKLLIIFGMKECGSDADSCRQEALLAKLEATSRTTVKQDVVDDMLKEFGF
ncbi:MAG: protein phosphatase CheZ [Nitrospirota bacterium]